MARVTWPKIVVLVVAVAAAGLFFRYGSAHPCEWYLHDLTAKSGMPKLLVRAYVHARNGGEDPGVGRCLKGWFEVHTDGVESQLPK